MTSWRLAIALAGLLTLVLIVSAPARLLGYFLPADSLSVHGYSGTLWRGSVADLAVRLPDGWLQLGPTRWTLSPWSLLILSPRIKLDSEWGPQVIEADIALSPSGALRLRDSSATFSASLVQQWLPVQLRGSLRLALAELHLSDERLLQGRGSLVWQGAFWRGVRGSQRLGDYVLEFEVPAEQQLRGTISTLSGPIRVEGGFEAAGRQYSVDVLMTSAEGFDSELASAMQLMAAPVEGGFHLKFNSEF